MIRDDLIQIQKGYERCKCNFEKVEGEEIYECSKCGGNGGFCWNCGQDVKIRKNKNFCKECETEIKQFAKDNGGEQK